MWLKVMVHASMPGFGPFTGVFSGWYRHAASGAVKDLGVLVKDNNFSMDLLPLLVENHIVEYAMDPFGLESQLICKIPFLLASQGIHPLFIEELLERAGMPSLKSSASPTNL
jgi:hypothetical protein